MKKTGICPKCGSKNVVDSDKPHGTRLTTHRWMCMDCGFIEWYAMDEYVKITQKYIEKGKI